MHLSYQCMNTSIPSLKKMESSKLFFCQLLWKPTRCHYFFKDHQRWKIKYHSSQSLSPLLRSSFIILNQNFNTWNVSTTKNNIYVHRNKHREFTFGYLFCITYLNVFTYAFLISYMNTNLYDKKTEIIYLVCLLIK